MPRQLSSTLVRETIAALAPAARAFDRAQRKGYAWIDPDQGCFFTHESDDLFRPAPPPNPEQLRLI